MFKSLLLATEGKGIDSLLLNVFIILGAVIAAALIVYLLWEAVNAIVNKNKNTEKADEVPIFKNNNKHDVFVADYHLDAEEEKVEEKPLFEEKQLIEVNEEKAEEEKEDIQAEEDRANAERRAYLEARRQELIKRMQAEMEEEEDEEIEEAQEIVEEEIPAPVALTQEEEEIPAVVEEKIEEVEEEQVDHLVEERNALNAERERYEAMVKELEAAKKALAEQQLQETVVVEQPVAVTPVQYSLEELQAKLAEAEERLRTTEKEFKQCKKEYIPLKKVWVAHEKDEKKLRRKEALVAKQKVLLYGVNNYADIDEEKAQKLAEDLDLLDGLKLSVQHCEEVMKKNQERYPLLEKMYNVLKLRNDELKRDIAKYREEIAKIEAENAESATDAE